MPPSCLDVGEAHTASTVMLSDWTEDLPQTDHVQFFRNVDWSRTELGSTAQWGTALRMYTHMVMSDSRAATLYWGPTRVAIYNEHFAPLAAGQHPKLMGQTFAWGFPELVGYIGPLLDNAARAGVAQDVVEAPMMVERSGYKEEAFFTGNFTPIRGTEGDVVGFYNALFEVTSQKIYERRIKLLNLLAATPGGLEIREVYSHILTTLQEDSYDIPMAILYEADILTEPETTTLRLKGQFGLPQNHDILRDGHDLKGDDDIVSLYRQAITGRVVTTVDDRFAGVEWLGFQDPPDKVVTFALTTGIRLFGFLTVGTNPYRPFDASCEQFIKDLTRMISGVIALAWDAQDLRTKQQQLQSELELSDMKVLHLVQHALVGMAHANSDGKIIWANDKFLSLAHRIDDKDTIPDDIYEVFLDEDRAKAETVWAQIMNGDNHISAELRLKRAFVPPVGGPEPAYVQMLAFPYKEQGKAISVMACVTDISRLKWAEAWQTRLAHDAREAKSQQEQFIDIVSHEMRNPLSAIFHSAEIVAHTLKDLQVNVDMNSIPSVVIEAFQENVLAASTILDCAKHQKRIIDDILTLGRLESTLLSVKPSAITPSRLVDTVLSLFEAELRSNMIHTNVIAGQSIQDLDISHLYLDPSRVTQIFINLLTNAIKFVKKQPMRTIEIRYGATLTPPRSIQDHDFLSTDLHWAPIGKNAVDVTKDPVWGNGEVLFLTFSLSDTGIGMHESEISNIFERFEQANLKTHVTYGGSGLGLYISKELTERMAGEIGVSSQPGKGSKFVFYIKTRRATAKDVPLQLRPSPTKSQSLSTAPTLHVLLVEDNLINQRVLKRHLTKCKFSVEVANHGLEALDLLKKPGMHFDVVLMDVQMPIMDGLTCTTHIRKLERAGILKGRLPIIAVTANVRQEHLDSATTAGLDRVVQKPFQVADLVALMHELIISPVRVEVGAAEPAVDVREMTLTQNEAAMGRSIIGGRSQSA